MFEFVSDEPFTAFQEKISLKSKKGPEREKEIILIQLDGLFF